MNVFLASLPVIFSPRGYYYSEYVAQCSWGISELSFVAGHKDLWFGITYTTIILPWLLPGVVVVVSCIVSIISLVHSSRIRRMMAPKACNGEDNIHAAAGRKARKATVTIIIMTGVYMVFNMPCWLLYSYLLASTHNPMEWLRGDVALYVQIFVSRLSVVLNGTANPLVYFTRIEALGKIATRARNSLSDSVVYSGHAMRLVPRDGKEQAKKQKSKEQDTTLKRTQSTSDGLKSIRHPASVKKRKSTH